MQKELLGFPSTIFLFIDIVEQELEIMFKDRTLLPETMKAKPLSLFPTSMHSVRKKKKSAVNKVQIPIVMPTHKANRQLKKKNNNNILFC